MARRSNPFDPSGMFNLMLAQQKFFLSSMETIWYRSMRIASGAMTPTENASMWMEKPTAFVTGMEKAVVAAASGKPAHRIVEAAMAPVAAKASSNAKRLRRRAR